MTVARILPLVAIALFLPGAPAAAESFVEGLEMSGTTTYRLEPDDGVVHVTVEIDLENTMPSRTVGDVVQTPYFDFFQLPAVGEVDDVEARSSDGGRLDVDVERQDRQLRLLTVDLEPDLVHGDPQEVTVEYDLRGQPPRSASVTRVNDAFGSWLLIASGDPDRADVVVDVPAGFELTLSTTLPAETSIRGNREIHRITGIRDFDEALFFASASNESKLDKQALSVAGTQITVKGWPGDRQWQRFAARTLRRGLPLLEDLVGMAAPESELTVVESSRSYTLGYAGFYVPELQVVEVGDRLDKAVMLHELSHIWFNHSLFEDRWISEGLAEEISNRALARLGEKRARPKPVDAAASEALALNAWPSGVPLDAKRMKIESFAYNASFSVMHALTNEIGLRGLRQIIAAATERQLPYRGDPPPEEVQTVRDWRYFLDLAELVAGSRRVEDLLTAHALTDAQAAQLTDRARAQESLDDLAEAGQGWTPPLEVRREMSEWDFARAERLIDDAQALLSRGHELSDELDALGVDSDAVIETAYETSDALDELESALGPLEQLTGEVVELQEQWERADPVTRLGMLGVDVDGSAEQGDPQVAVASVSAALDQAPARGRTILLAVTGALLLLVVLGLVAGHRRRPRRGEHEREIDVTDEAHDDSPRSLSGGAR